VAVGGSHTLAVDNHGTLVAGGDNSYGQLGKSTLTDSSGVIPVSALDGITTALFPHRERTIACMIRGACHSARALAMMFEPFEAGAALPRRVRPAIDGRFGRAESLRAPSSIYGMWKS
jgi:hypothetical protein